MGTRDRLQDFRRIRSNVRGSDKYLLVGIDVAKSTHHAFFGTATGRTVAKRLVFENDQRGFQLLLCFAADLQKRHCLPEAIFAVEPTASYHKPLAEYLIRAGEHVVYVSTVAAKRNRELLAGRWDKNDKKCAANVADLVSQGRFLYYDLQEPRLRELSSLLRSRAWLKKQQQRTRMRVRNHLVAQYFPELDPQFPAQRLVLSTVRTCLDPREIAAMDYFEFAGLVARKNRGEKENRRIETIWRHAAESVGCEMPKAVQWEARMLVDHLTQLQDNLREAEARIHTIAESLPAYECLLSIPGFGPIVSAMVLAAIGDPHRFDNRRQLLRLAGLDLMASRSGKNSSSVVPVISKQGKTDLRCMMVHAAQVSATKNLQIHRHYTNLLDGRQHERGIRLKMKIKLSAKLLVVAWTLMKRQEMFDPTKFEVP